MTDLPLIVTIYSKKVPCNYASWLLTVKVTEKATLKTVKINSRNPFTHVIYICKSKPVMIHNNKLQSCNFKSEDRTKGPCYKHFTTVIYDCNKINCGGHSLYAYWLDYYATVVGYARKIFIAMAPFKISSEYLTKIVMIEVEF